MAAAQAPPHDWAAATEASGAPRRGVRCWLRPAVHVAVVGCSWTLLVLFWIRALRLTEPAAVLGMLRLVGVTLVVTLAVTGLWVVHNLRIHRRKGPRRAAAPVAEAFTGDVVGRSLVADWENLRAAPVVSIALDGARKRYDVRPVTTARRWSRPSRG